MSAGEVELTISPAIRAALSAIEKHKPSPELKAFCDSERAQMPYSAIEQLSNMYRANVPEEERQRLRPQCGSGWVHELVKGCDLYMSKKPAFKSERPPEFEKRMQKLRATSDREEAQSYLTGMRGVYHKAEDVVTNASTMSFVGEGINLLACMAGGFAIFWYMGSHLFPYDKPMMAVVSGLVGMLLALAVEVVLIAVREQKKDLFHASKAKVARSKSGMLRASRGGGGWRRSTGSRNFKPKPPKSLASLAERKGKDRRKDGGLSNGDRSKSGFSPEIQRAIYGDMERYQTVKT